MFGNILKKKDYFDKLEKFLNRFNDVSILNKYTDEEKLDAAAINYGRYVYDVEDTLRSMKRDIDFAKNDELLYELIDEEKDKTDHDMSNLNHIQMAITDYIEMKKSAETLGDLTYFLSLKSMLIYDSMYDLSDFKNVYNIIVDLKKRCTRPDIVEFMETRYERTAYHMPEDPDYSDVVTLGSVAEHWKAAARTLERYKACENKTYNRDDYFNENGWLVDDEGNPIGTDMIALHPVHTNSIDFKGLDKLPLTPFSQACVDGDLGAMTKMLTDEIQKLPRTNKN